MSDSFNFSNGDLILIEGKAFRIEDFTLIPVDSSITVKNLPLKDLKNQPGKEFVVYGNTCVEDSALYDSAVYLGTKVNSQRYYHVLNRNTMVQVIEFKP